MTDAALRVLIVDDHPVVRAGLAALLEADASMEVVGTAASVAEADSIHLESAPDVCVVDLQLPDGDGITLGVSLKHRWPETRVLMLTMTSDPGAVIRCLGSGLDGYVLKDADPEELRAAIAAAAHGSTVLGRGASDPLVVAASVLPDVSPLAALDARDREILSLLVRGMGPSQIGEQLYLSPKTIRNRISTILAKLGVGSRDEAIALGVAGGLGV